MVTKTLVERIRDAVPGKNMLVKIEELKDLGLENVVVIRAGEQARRSYDLMDLARGDFNYFYIDTKWVENYTLGDESANEVFKKAAEDASKKYFHYSHKPYSEMSPEEMKRANKEESLLDEERAKLQAAYYFLRPEKLLELLKDASLVIAPKHLLGKIAKEGGIANLAELVDRNSETSGLYANPADNNYPRILVSPSEVKGFPQEDVSRIDSKTISLLYKHEDESRSHSFNMWSFMELLGKGKIDERFLSVLKSLDMHFEAIPRTAYKQPLSERQGKLNDLFSKFGLDDSDDDTDFGLAGSGILERPEFDGLAFPKKQKRGSSGAVQSNYYGLGGKSNNFRFVGNEYEKRLVAGRRTKVAEIYESFWIAPLDTLEEIHERQDFLEALVTDAGQAEAFSSLEEGINSMVMPYLHLSNMANNISANILHSRWGTGIMQPEFHKDFLRIAKQFTDAYEKYSGAFASYVPRAREVRVLLGAINHDEENSLAKAYAFLKGIIDSQPADYGALLSIFKEELKRRGARLVPELEAYDPANDGGVEMSKLPKKSKGKSLDGYKSPMLKRLLNRLHWQNPVMQAHAEMEMFDRVGAKLASYSAISEFIRQSHWVKPVVVPESEGIIDIRKGWYPLTYLQHTSRFVRNDTYLSADQRIEILDGINVGGKTIDMKKTFLIVCLALTGMYVPAEYAKISMFNRVRFRLKNTGFGGEGAFAEELDEITPALEAIGKPILMGIDETFTSTNPLEGEAMTYGLIKYISQNPTARGMFTSHYPTLHDMAGSVSGVKFAHFPFKEYEGKLIFPHEKAAGPNLLGDYAIPIAKSQGISPEILSKALTHLERFKNA
jgi:hypothetical protein